MTVFQFVIGSLTSESHSRVGILDFSSLENAFFEPNWSKFWLILEHRDIYWAKTVLENISSGCMIFSFENLYS